ncbi:MAG TPA: Gfo/Idh/MocA family oxidoreductase [Chloroflexota bacterium]|nr:Gfo/Idh/MocA family oxidoreductase [Chloroflexota bacterium]
MKPAGSNDLGAERSYASAEEALRDPEIEVADLCLPHRWHAPIAVAAARASKHVFVEKPIADTLEEADQMIAAYESIRQGRAMRLPLVPAGVSL